MNNKYQAPLLPGEFYHLFNRANTQGEKLFPQERHYRYFLQKWAEYLGDSMEVLAYCLIPNHFHFLVRIQRDNTPSRGVIPSATWDNTPSRGVIPSAAWDNTPSRGVIPSATWDNTPARGVIPDTGKTPRDNTPSRGVIPSIPESFRRLFITYTQAINKQEQRRGSLFQEHPKRLKVESDSHLLGLIRYIHNNPVHHGLVSNLENWHYSSYHAILTPASTRVSREYVLDLFGGKGAFVAFHQQMTEVKEIAYCIVEE